MRKNKPFTANQFTPTEFSTAQQKSEFGNWLIDFIGTGFKRTKFHKKMYNRLSMCFGHIAHYDQGGFFEVWFCDSASRLKFIQNLLRYPCYGDPEHTFSDVEKKIINEAKRFVEPLLDARLEEIEASDRSELQRLKEKYEV